MEKLKEIKEKLVDCIYEQMADVCSIDTDEMMKAADILKDISKTIYNCTIVEAMNEQSKQDNVNNYYYHEYYYPDRDLDKHTIGRMYYTENNKNNMRSHTNNDSHSSNDGHSYLKRRYYMESKKLNHDKEVMMKDLEDYLKDLSTDITEMIEDASLEERQLLQKKLANLVNKINVSN